MVKREKERETNKLITFTRIVRRAFLGSVCGLWFLMLQKAVVFTAQEFRPAVLRATLELRFCLGPGCRKERRSSGVCA